MTNRFDEDAARLLEILQDPHGWDYTYIDHGCGCFSLAEAPELIEPLRKLVQKGTPVTMDVEDAQAEDGLLEGVVVTEEVLDTWRERRICMIDINTPHLQHARAAVEAAAV